MSKKWICDFCNRTEDEVAHVVVTQSEVAICSECVVLCTEIIAASKKPTGASDDVQPPAGVPDRKEVR
ncbi:ClpX C4-type zinc finger protein [Burkholderia cepacia]|uniref:ClpX C4-type zinc finger protein n=1 Tax=Burkholderia cepacia TaxID=292 RepID=UPI000DD058E2|nr:ClpX C4-type zinc finger protein [Burkholderia cepacia]